MYEKKLAGLCNTWLVSGCVEKLLRLCLHILAIFPVYFSVILLYIVVFWRATSLLALGYYVLPSFINKGFIIIIIIVLAEPEEGCQGTKSAVATILSLENIPTIVFMYLLPCSFKIFINMFAFLYVKF